MMTAVIIIGMLILLNAGLLILLREDWHAS